MKFFFDDYLINFVLRYFFIVLIGILLSFDFFVGVLKVGLTYLSYWLLKLFLDVSLVEGVIMLAGNGFVIVDACVGMFTYLLFALLFFSIPMKFAKAFKLFCYSFVVFTFFNLLRIVLLVIVFALGGRSLFYGVHLLFYEFLSGVVSVLIFIYFHRKYGLKGVPFVSDFKKLLIYFKLNE